jgi:hypothetical protein
MIIGMIKAHRVGSTSVPGLAAKPVIDCDIVVAEKDVAAAGTTARPAAPRRPCPAGPPATAAGCRPGRVARAGAWRPTAIDEGLTPADRQCQA